MRKRNPNFNIALQRKLPYVACLFKSSGKKGPWTVKCESCHGSKVLIHLIHPDTPGKVHELMEFRKLTHMILIALVEANYSILSHFEHFVLEAIGSTVVRGKTTELYELLVWFDFTFFYNLFFKPNHCFMNNVLVSMNFWILTSSPFLSCPCSSSRIFCLSCNCLIHLHEPYPFIRAWVLLLQHTTGNEWQKFFLTSISED